MFLYQGGNRGLSSWAHAHILTYPNGTRTILTMMGDRWHAAHEKNPKSIREKPTGIV